MGMWAEEPQLNKPDIRQVIALNRMGRLTEGWNSDSGPVSMQTTLKNRLITLYPPRKVA